MARPMERHEGYSAPPNTYVKKAKVAIVKAYDYECAQIYTGVEKGIELIGGLEKIVKPRSSIFVKISHLSPSRIQDLLNHNESIIGYSLMAYLTSQQTQADKG